VLRGRTSTGRPSSFSLFQFFFSFSSLRGSHREHGVLFLFSLFSSIQRAEKRTMTLFLFYALFFFPPLRLKKELKLTITPLSFSARSSFLPFMPLFFLQASRKRNGDFSPPLPSIPNHEIGNARYSPPSFPSPFFSPFPQAEK